MFITPEIANSHLRLTDGEADAADLALKSAAAERAAVAYLDRAVFADQPGLDAAIAAVPAALSAAQAAYVLALADAALIADTGLRLIEQSHAADVYARALFAAARTRRGLVIEPLVLSAMLLILGDLWGSREDTAVGVSVAAVPFGARCLLDAYRHWGG